MSLTPPKRLFHIPSMSTVKYKDVVDDGKGKGYVAISHVWGDQKLYTADGLGISGVNWEIPLSDTNKISRLVNAMKHCGMEYCWWDILCVPQDKQDEINLEIPFMGDYFSGAEMTFALSTISYDLSPNLLIWSNIVSTAINQGRCPNPEEREWMMNGPGNLVNFHEDKWFTRVWTLQEHILSDNIILIGLNGLSFSLSDIVTKLSYLLEGDSGYMRNFTESAFLLEIIAALNAHRNGTLDLATILRASAYRNCHKIHDRFYGVFGILGYKDFTISYDMSIDDLNKLVAKFAHSKRDVSWIAVGGDNGAGFIQPMYRQFPYIGKLWKENIPCVKFLDEMYVHATEFKTISLAEIYVGSGDVNHAIKWTIKTFTEWGFSYFEIFSVMMGYIGMSPGFVRVGEHILSRIFDGVLLEEMADDAEEYITSIGGNEYFTKIMSKLSCYSYLHTITAVKAGDCPLIISGNASIKDTIVVTKIRDDDGRFFGIVAYNYIRKGICLMSEDCVYGQPFQHKFLLDP